MTDEDTPILKMAEADRIQAAINRNTRLLLFFYSRGNHESMVLLDKMRILEKLTADLVTFQFIDVDRSPDVMARFQIRGTPSVSFFKDQVEICRMRTADSGVIEKILKSL